MPSIIIDLPVPRPPTRTLRFSLKCTVVSRRNPPSHVHCEELGMGFGFWSLCKRIRESGSGNACRKSSTETADILMRQEAPSLLRSSGPFMSEAFRIARGRTRLCWGSLFSKIGLIPPGTLLIGPGIAQASRSGWAHALILNCPKSGFIWPVASVR